jgi:hypothetical protein
MQYNEPLSLAELLDLDPQVARANLEAQRKQRDTQTPIDVQETNTEPVNDSTVETQQNLYKLSAKEAAREFTERLNQDGPMATERRLISLSLNSQTEINEALALFGFKTKSLSTPSRESLKTHYREILKIVHPDQYCHETDLFNCYNNITRELNRIYAQLSTQINN